jgi:hypothetical protein
LFLTSIIYCLFFEIILNFSMASDLQTAPLAAHNFHMLEGAWPMAHWFSTFTVNTGKLNAIRKMSGGIDLTSEKGYLSLGQFYIHTSLLELHPVQRLPTTANIDVLEEKFRNEGIRRTENVGVIIGLGEGWNQLNKTTREPIYISHTSPHINRLSKPGTNIIGQVIRGGHRTLAIRKFSKAIDHPEQNFWLYEVYIPGMLRQ